jgi:hypothetical protein
MKTQTIVITSVCTIAAAGAVIWLFKKIGDAAVEIVASVAAEVIPKIITGGVPDTAKE